MELSYNPLNKGKNVMMLVKSPAQRSSLIFILGLALAAVLAVAIDGGWRYQMRAGTLSLDLSDTGALELRAPAPLTEANRAAAQRAWTYFDRYTQDETGLVNSVGDFPSTTLWDQGSYVFALVAAARLGIIGPGEFDTRVDRLLNSFDQLPLFDGRLPNKAYDTRTLAMVDYENTPVPDGLGWSALDIARMLMAFRALEKHFPDRGMRVRAVIARWDLSAMAFEGELWGAERIEGEIHYHQEGRIGYEQYGARAAAMWGMDVSQAISARRALGWTDVQGVEVPMDLRRAVAFGAITPILSEPYMLLAIELGLDSETRLLADKVFRAQQQRFSETGVLTMVSEDHINQSPHFLYNSVFSNGTPWAVVTENGTFHPELRTLSVKAAIAWDAIYGNDYTQLLRNQIEGIGDISRGWPAGIYEADGTVNDIYTLNTNGVVLEAIHHTVYGPLWQTR